MKRALYYSVRVKTLYPYVVAVTSEKPSRWGRTRWYGRDCRHDESTNGTTDDLRGRFGTALDAERMVASIKAIADRYDAQRKVLNDQVSALHRAERDEVDALFNKEEASEQA